MVKSRTLNHVQYDKMFVTGFYYSLSLEISMHYALCTMHYSLSCPSLLHASGWDSIVIPDSSYIQFARIECPN
jgi:hypothetical protein